MKQQYYYWLDRRGLVVAYFKLQKNEVDGWLRGLIESLANGIIPDELKDYLKGPHAINPFPRPHPIDWKIIKARILERDDYTCAYCGKRGVKLEPDHVIAVSRGGSHLDENLVAACVPCNRSKSNKLLEEWRPHGAS
jgi:hypothetical protein